LRIGILAARHPDLLGAKLIQTLHERCPDLHIEGIGGPAMIAAGCTAIRYRAFKRNGFC
jgi:lipid A disaccharide synthetase